MRKFLSILILLLTFPAWSNTFRRLEGADRFTLEIKTDELVYKSELMNKTIKLNLCGRKIAGDLNRELLALVPKTETPKGLLFMVDKTTVRLDPEGTFAKKIRGMNVRMMRFFSEERKRCH